jgi:hypothetical protein
MPDRNPTLLYPHLRKVLLEPVLHLFHGMSGAKLQTIMALVASCRFIFSGMCLFVCIYASAHS